MSKSQRIESVLLKLATASRNLQGNKGASKVISLRLGQPMQQWLEIMAKRTGIAKSDIVEYALLAACGSTSEILFIDYILTHKARKQAKDKRDSPAKKLSIVQGLDIASAHLFDMTEAQVKKEWSDQQ